MKLAIVLGTVRENRLSERLAKWVMREATQHDGVEAELVDLKDYPMPFFDEPISPRYNPNRKVNEVAQTWLAKLNAADAYVYVTPEYNHSIPAVLKNALDYVTWEMVKKPAAVVSHGTVGGARATMHLKEILSESRACIIPAQVAFHGRVGELLDEQGNLAEAAKAQPYGPQTALKNMLDELKWYSDALDAARSRS
jgi:NAD(P)H-dependent FMN reductase